MNIKISILTEGSSQIGFGHVARCSSLYDAFMEKDIIPEFIVNADRESAHLLEKGKHTLLNWLKTKEVLPRILKTANIVIVDSYLAGHDLYKMISESAAVPLFIDDYKRIDYPGGIVLNGTIHAEEIGYPEKEGLSYLLGSSYVPLRKEFWEAPEAQTADKAETLLLTFGGADSKDLTPRVLQMLALHYPKMTKKVIVGQGFKNRNEIKKAADDKTELIYHPDAAGMKKAMLESDLAISASGQTLYELARLGVPTVAVSVADNQAFNISGFRKEGAIEYAGAWDDGNLLDNIRGLLEKLADPSVRARMSLAEQQSVNGQGAIRVAKECLKRYIEKSITLRPAEETDSDIVLDLSNQDDIRGSSFYSATIAPEEHARWFSSKLTDNDFVYLLVFLGDTFVGQIRFEKKNDTAVISINLYKEYRGLGIGETILRMALEHINTALPGIRSVTALLKKNNAASIAFFEGAGFKYIKESVVHKQKALKYRFEINND